MCCSAFHPPLPSRRDSLWPAPSLSGANQRVAFCWVRSLQLGAVTPPTPSFPTVRGGGVEGVGGEFLAGFPLAPPFLRRSFRLLYLGCLWANVRLFARIRSLLRRFPPPSTFIVFLNRKYLLMSSGVEGGGGTNL